MQNGEHDRGEGKQALRTCNVYWNPQEPIDDYDIDELILGMSSQVTEREDTIITPDLRGKFYTTYLTANVCCQTLADLD